MGKVRNVYKILVRKPSGKRPHGEYDGRIIIKWVNS
jgi:hypothetical protein